MRRLKKGWWVCAIFTALVAFTQSDLFPVGFIVVLMTVFNCIMILSNYLRKRMLSSAASYDGAIGRYIDTVVKLPPYLHKTPYILAVLFNVLFCIGSVFFAWYLVFSSEHHLVPPIDSKGILWAEETVAGLGNVSPNPLSVMFFCIFVSSEILYTILANLRLYDAWTDAK